MRVLKPIGIIAGILLMVLCFVPWVIIESRGITVTGVSAAGTNFGKPGYLHLFFTSIYLLLLMIPQVWSRRVNLFLAAFNVAWAVKNFILISACAGGDCPAKQPALYLLVVLSVLMLLVLLFAPEKEDNLISADPLV